MDQYTESQSVLEKSGKRMYPELCGKHVLVTGAARGFGRAIALRLAKEGAKIVVNYRRSKTDAEEVVQEIHAFGGEAFAARGDIGKEDKLSELFQEIQEKFDHLDILVANAAFGVPGPVLDINMKHWDVTMHSSAHSLLLMTQFAVPLMSSGWGRIISITSEGGQKVLPGYGIIGVAKAALESLTRTLAVELAPRGILVNGVLAGIADTKSFRAIPGAEDKIKTIKEKNPTGRIITPEDVANVVTFLCSNEAAMICGQFITVDGGRAITA